MASCWSSQFQSAKHPTKLPDFASYARANAEYFYYCSQWWWEMFLRGRGESGTTCECTELQSARGPSSLCECSFRDTLYGGSSCGDGANVGSISEAYNYGRYRFGYNYDWNQFYEMPVPFRTDIRGHCDNSTEYTKDDDQKCQEWTDIRRHCDNPTEDTKDEQECQEDSEADVGAETIEMEVNEDFRKFLEQSKRYREERDKSKANKESSEEDYVEVGSVPVVATSRPPSEQQGSVRKKAMKDLYGQQSEHIMSLETSLQLNYDRNCDIRRPIFWPSIPLKF